MALVGPTASSKSELAFRLAQLVEGEILSVDSMQVYRGMDIGTAKPSADERQAIRHHMIDLVEPEQPYTVSQFQSAGRKVIETDGPPLVIVGGSGLHLRSLVDDLEFPPSDSRVRADIEALSAPEARRRLLEADPDAGTHVDLANPRRVIRALEILELTGLTPTRRLAQKRADKVRRFQARYQFTGIGVDPGDGLDARISARLAQMMKTGLLAEVERLAPRLGPTARQAVGYRQLRPVVEGEKTEEEGVAEALAATRSLAKRQRTFFRRDPRLTWVAWDEAFSQIQGLVG